MRRSQAKSHCPILSKVMDVEEPEVKIAVVGLLWALLRNGRQRMQVEKLRQGRNLAHDPIVRRRGDNPGGVWCGLGFTLKEDYSLVISIGSWKNCD